MIWCFAIVNNRLAEIYVTKVRGKTRFYGHACVSKSEFKSKKQQKWIEEDTKKFKFVFRNGKYRSTIGEEKVFELATMRVGKAMPYEYS